MCATSWCDLDQLFDLTIVTLTFKILCSVGIEMQFQYRYQTQFWFCISIDIEISFHAIKSVFIVLIHPIQWTIC